MLHKDRMLSDEEMCCLDMEEVIDRGSVLSTIDESV